MLSFQISVKRSGIRIGLAAAVAVAALAGGCKEKPAIDAGRKPKSAPAPAPRPPRAAAAVAYESGVAALGREAFLNAQDAWILDRALRRHVDPVLGGLVARHVALLLRAQDPAQRLFNPRERGRAVPRGQRRGVALYLASTAAPFADGPAAVRLVGDFVARDRETGAVLDMQLVTLLWAEASGMKLGSAVRARKDVLVRRIAEEMAKTVTFSDLFAERAALLALFGRPSREQLARWAQVIVPAQASTGHWRDPGEQIAPFDGESLHLRPSPGHTTASCVAFLAAAGPGELAMASGR